MVNLNKISKTPETNITGITLTLKQNTEIALTEVASISLPYAILRNENHQSVVDIFI